MSRPRIALTWCAGCGGCEESILDLGEALFELADQIEIVYWPVALDARKTDLEALPDGSLDAAFVNGAITTGEDEKMARLLRRKARRVFAHGACAHLGGVVGLANLHPEGAVAERVYTNLPNRSGLPPLRPRVASLGQVIEVDFTIPGCPPTPAQMGRALWAVARGELPPGGTVFAEDRALCSSCPRRDTLPDVPPERLRGLAEGPWDGERCFLAQGLVCLGPATRGGCDARCLGGNMPCRGCFGPADHGALDPGSGPATVLASLLPSQGFTEALDRVPDPAGLCYRYGAAGARAPGGRKGPR